MKSIEANEDEPDGLQIDEASHQGGDPSQAHDDGQPQVKAKVSFGTAGAHLGPDLGGADDHISATHEEEHVGAHDAGKWKGEVDQESLLVAEPTKLVISKT